MDKSSQDPQAGSGQERAKEWRTPVWAWGALVLIAALIFGALTLFGGEGGDVSLPPGFTITTGADSGEGSEENPSSDPGSLGDLIAATGAGESDRFEASIAILPLSNRTGDVLFDTLGRGMTEELYTRLSRIRGLNVIAPQSVRELEGSDLTPTQVADTLKVDHLLQGTAFPHDDVARILVSLLRVEGEVELWSNDYSLDRTNQMRAVEDISDEVSAALLEDVPSLSARGASRSTESPAYVPYLAGSRLLNARTRDGVTRAIDAFRDAIEEDSAYAPAYSGLSSAYALAITYRYDIGVDGFASAALALSAAEEAVRLDPDLADAYASRGYISSVALAPAQVALADFTRALELQPNLPNVRAWYANLLVRERYYDEALAEAQQAVTLDPLSPSRRTGLAFEALRAGDFGLAIQEARTAGTLGPEIVLPRSIQALALLLSGRAEECLELDLGPHAGIRAICLHDIGRLDQAEAIVDSLRTALQSGEQVHPDFTNVIPAGDLAAFYAWTGSPDRAMPFIYRAFALSPSGIDPRVLESGVFEQLFSSGQRRREVAEIRGRIWTRVQRELTEAEPALGIQPG
jgi:TolB-like protein